MKINFVNLPNELEQGLAAIERRFNIERSAGGIAVEAASGAELAVSLSGGTGKIIYPSRAAFFRAVGLLV